jgi:lysozyme
MNDNQATVDLIKEFEGFRANAYRDAVGIWTIGYGTTAMAGVGIKPAMGMTISQSDAEAYLCATLNKFAVQIAPAITAPINENEFGAFVSLAYNIGPGAFKKSSALREFNAGNKKKAADAILLWNKAGGKVLRGLTRRREAERKLFLTPANGDKQTSDRSTVLKSTTVQASAAQIVTGVTAAGTAVGALDGTAQIVALAFAGIVILAGLWIMRERIKKWAEGDR